MFSRLPTLGFLGLSLAACSGSSLPLETLEHDGEDREYFLHVPASHDSSSSAPLLFNFHGFGGTASSQLDWSDFRALADTHGFLLVYPQGTELSGSTHWNSGLPGEDNKSPADDFGFITALIEHISESYGVDSDRIYATGYSNGGFLSYSLACYHSDRFAAIAAVSSTMLNEFDGDCAPVRAVPVFSANGTSDSTVPYEGGTEGYQAIADVLDYWVTNNQITDEPVVTSVTDSIEHTLYSGGENDSAVEHYRIEGGEHVWFSDDFGGSDLNTLIWNFLSAHQLTAVQE